MTNKGQSHRQTQRNAGLILIWNGLKWAVALRSIWHLRNAQFLCQTANISWRLTLVPQMAARVPSTRGWLCWTNGADLFLSLMDLQQQKLVSPIGETRLWTNLSFIVFSLFRHRVYQWLVGVFLTSCRNVTATAAVEEGKIVNQIVRKFVTWIHTYVLLSY